MIPLGSCTMKLNATTEMMPVTWPEFAGLHPFAPPDAGAGLPELFQRLEAWLAEITGFAAVSLQPNAGSQGEYAGLLAIRAYHERRGDGDRNVCLIPSFGPRHQPGQRGHGRHEGGGGGLRRRTATSTWPICAAKAEQHGERLAALMVTYPSTHGVFEAGDPRDLRDRARQRRPGLHGRRQHERPGRV